MEAAGFYVGADWRLVRRERQVSLSVTGLGRAGVGYGVGRVQVGVVINFGVEAGVGVVSVGSRQAPG